ncbi:MAG: crossover junction endodeoxyribonuclease RuvC [Nitrospinota bacterium]|nr:MAG: crossover junction endodeoxyribonuclease RuvC [Nitrospinota bacterium]
MIVLGVDPGTRVTGYGLLADVQDPPAVLQWGTIQTTAQLPLPQRLVKIYTGIAELCTTFHPDVLVVESLFFARNARSTLTLSHTRGVILLAAAQANIEVIEYSPLAVKQAVVGYGRAEKHQVQRMVVQLLRLPPTLLQGSTDVTDALAVALCHLHSMRLQQKLSANA